MTGSLKNSNLRQATLSDTCTVKDIPEVLTQTDIEERGAVFTRKEVVKFILDLAGYVSNKPLYEQNLLEPSFGNGDFLLIIVDRLITSWRKHSPNLPVKKLAPCIRAIELHQTSFSILRIKLITHLVHLKINTSDAEYLADNWLIKDDFLLVDIPYSFNYVIGNPPYIRQERIPNTLLVKYRERYKSIFDRADIYIPFIERSLTLLEEEGTLGFICADRWMKNRYGGPLRKMIADNYHLKIYVDMMDTQSFHSEVSAYPAVTIITRKKLDFTRIAHRPKITNQILSALTKELLKKEKPKSSSSVKEIIKVTNGKQPWIFETSDELSLVRRLEQNFPSIEEAGCKIGIGVATGADKAFIGQYDDLDVEDDRKLPIAMTGDITSGHVTWHGYGIINPFSETGKLVELSKYPRLKNYLEQHKDKITKRHIAKKSPKNWYRTIDRIYPELALKPKLLIPDIKGKAHIVYENGQLYPHHNLYYITSDEWDLKALQAVLLSGIARIFVATYSTRMRGDYLRFQAQYLRRIRLPRRSDVSKKTLKTLINAAQLGDEKECNKAVALLYGLTTDEQAVLLGNRYV